MNEPQRPRTETPSTAFVRIENGQPVPVYAPIPTAKLINDMVYAAMSARYEPLTNEMTGEVLPAEKQFEGWTCLEVMNYKRAQKAAQGDYDSHKFMYERTLGKAVQQIHSTNVTLTLTKALDEIADKIEESHPGLIELQMATDAVIVTNEFEPESLSDF